MAVLTRLFWLRAVLVGMLREATRSARSKSRVPQARAESKRDESKDCGANQDDYDLEDDS